MKTDTPNIRAIRPGRGRELTIPWKGVVESAVDLGAYLTAYLVFAPLSDDGAFRAAEVGEWGWSVHWSDEMGVSTDTPCPRPCASPASGWTPRRELRETPAGSST